MLGTRLHIKAFRGDFDRYSEQFTKNLGHMCKTAGMMFLEQFLEGRKKFPVWTGMAKASLRPLGRYLGVHIEIDPKKKPRLNKEFGYWQSPATGEEMGEPPVAGDFFFLHSNVYGPFRVTFQWRTLVDHFLENDIYHVPRIEGTPWKYVENAVKAYDKCIKEMMKQTIPNMRSYLTPAETAQPFHEFSQSAQNEIYEDERNIIKDDSFDFGANYRDF